MVATWAISAVVFMVFGVGREEGDDKVNGGLGAAVVAHRVAACCYVPDAFGVDGAGEDDSCCCSIAGHFVGHLRDVLTGLDWGVSLCFSSMVTMIQTEHQVLELVF